MGFTNEVQKVPGVKPPAPSPAQAALQNVDIPHSRYGVLYLLGNIDIDMSALAITLEGVSALGNVAGAGPCPPTSATWGMKSCGTYRERHGPVAEDGLHSPVPGPKRSRRPAPSLKGKVDPATQPRHHVSAPPPPKRPEPGFPLTLAMYEMVKEDPILMLNPFMLGATLVGTVGRLQ